MSSNWSLEGNYFESCNCYVVCPCIFLEPPSEGFCDAQVAWSIDKGHLDGVDLSGRKVGVALHAPCDGQNKNLTDGGWSIALYVDDKASEEQFNAICELWNGNHGGHLAVIASLVGEVVSVEKAPITIEDTAHKKMMKIGNIGYVETKAVVGADGSPAICSNTPLAVGPSFDISVCKSVKNTYTGAAKNFSIEEGRAGLASQFKYGPN